MTHPEAKPSAPPVTCQACGALLSEERRRKPWCETPRCWAIANGEEEDYQRWSRRFKPGSDYD